MNDGDYVVVKTTFDELKGIVMNSSANDKLLLKLDSGYNISLNRKEIKSIKILTINEFKTINHEEKIVYNKYLKNIVLLHTGGTFASRVDYKTGAVSASFNPEDIIKIVPEIKDIANLKSRLVRNMFSEDMNFNHYNLLAKEIEFEINSGICNGIIITHGTDTMHYTAMALSFILKNLNIPVIITGAQRSSDRGSSDAFLNLVCSMKFIAKSDFVGVGICMHESINDDSCLVIPGFKSRKMHSSRRDAFRVVNGEPIARVNKEGIEFLSDYPKKQENKEKLKVMMFNPELKIGILKIHPNFKFEELKRYGSFDGLIIEGFGIGGHLPINKIDEYTDENKSIRDILKKISKKIPVIATTQTIYGRVNMKVYSTGREMLDMGILGDYSDIGTECSFIKLAWLLSNYSKEETIQMFNKNISGELNSRTQQDYF